MTLPAIVEPHARFELGHVVITPGAYDLYQHGLDPLDFLMRHIRCDWSEMSEHDRRENERAIDRGTRVFSRFDLPATAPERAIWIITEADRSSTTILLPNEY